MSHVTRIHASCHTYECVTSRHVTSHRVGRAGNSAKEQYSQQLTGVACVGLGLSSHGCHAYSAPLQRSRYRLDCDVPKVLKWRTISVRHCTALQHTAIRCNTLPHTAMHCNALHHTVAHCNTPYHAVPHCTTLLHNATPSNTQQHTATHRTTLYHTATPCNTLQHPAAHCNKLQHTATHCNTS
jgi:hypothetical protein